MPLTYLSDLFTGGAGPLPIVDAMIAWAERGALPADVCSPGTLPVACAQAIDRAMALGWLLGLLSW